MKTIRAVLLSLFLLPLAHSHAAPVSAPQFALANSRGEMVFKSSIKGNIIVSFFASYCQPCKKELPLLVEMEKKYGRGKNLSLVIISADINDGERSAKDKAAAFLKKIGVTRDFLVDVYHVVIEKYNPKKTLPATFLVNRQGYIVFSEIGVKEDTMARLEKAIAGLR
jgi:cytochrome c biogenesis protein CcmG, thiol:disulfide interchange protein DsbE